jgi:hypothetical protein
MPNCPPLPAPGQREFPAPQACTHTSVQCRAYTSLTSVRCAIAMGVLLDRGRQVDEAAHCWRRSGTSMGTPPTTVYERSTRAPCRSCFANSATSAPSPSPIPWCVCVCGRARAFSPFDVKRKPGHSPLHEAPAPEGGLLLFRRFRKSPCLPDDMRFVRCNTKVTAAIEARTPASSGAWSVWGLLGAFSVGFTAGLATAPFQVR